MSKRNRICLATVFFAAFAVWTVAVCFVDVQSIGPQGSAVGFATVNGAFHRLTGLHMALYTITDWLSLIPVAVICGFGLLGLVQWIRRKRLQRVDQSILVLGGFYLAVAAVYGFFELAVVNCRPVLIEGALEASYPSSTTVLALCVMLTAAMQFCARIRHPGFRRCAAVLADGFAAFMVLGRLLSGVHWVTDIVGGILLSTGLVLLYAALVPSDG